MSSYHFKAPRKPKVPPLPDRAMVEHGGGRVEYWMDGKSAVVAVMAPAGEGLTYVMGGNHLDQRLGLFVERRSALGFVRRNVERELGI